ncbi:hypothetical protein AAY473_017497, partial [Plecturocebus cupreus]
MIKAAKQASVETGSIYIINTNSRQRLMMPEWGYRHVPLHPANLHVFFKLEMGFHHVGHLDLMIHLPQPPKVLGLQFTISLESSTKIQISIILRAEFRSAAQAGECSGAIWAPCNFHLLGSSNSHASVSLVAGTT